MWDQKIPVHILTGFLGSGKTSFLSRILQLPEFKNTAVLINEFGSVGLDRDLLENSTEEMVVQLEGGCICCSVRGDLEESLLAMEQKKEAGEFPPFDRIIIETTGLADPGPILSTFMDQRSRLKNFSLKSITTVVDGVNGLTTLQNQPESPHQLAVADSILITKLDLLENNQEAARESLDQKIRELNPSAPIYRIPADPITPEIILREGAYDSRINSLDVKSWLGVRPMGGSQVPLSPVTLQEPHNHGSTIRNFEIIRETPIPRKAFGLLLSYLTSKRGEDLLRIKGIVQIEESPDTPMIIHGVQHMIHPPKLLDQWPSEDRRSRIVFITRNLKEETIQSMLEAVIQIVESGNR